MISETIMNSLVLKNYNHPHPYSLGWVHEDTILKFTKQCKLKFSICAKFIDEFVINVILLDIYDVILGNPYIWDKYALYYRNLNKYKLIKNTIFFMLVLIIEIRSYL